METYRGGGRLKPVNHKLSHKEKNYIAYCEKFYFLNKQGFPSPEQAAAALRYHVSEVKTFMLNEQVRNALERRGLPWQNAEAQSGQLTPTQIATAVLMCNFADPRSEDEKLTELGVQPAQYYAWLNDPIYQSYVSNLASRNIDNARPAALTNFAKMVREGKDLKALQYYFEVTGEFQSAQVQNLQSMLQLVVEAVQEYVKDPVILAKIAQRLMSAVPGVATGVKVDPDKMIEADTTGRSNIFTS
jgi:Helix-turn-helix of insertion element transposase